MRSCSLLLRESDIRHQAAKFIPGGTQPDLQTPTLISYSLRIQRELSPNTSISVGYVGSHGYHELLGIDANEPFPVICPASPCPANYPGTFPTGIANTPVPAGTLLSTLIAFVGIYAVFLTAFLIFTLHMIRRGPEVSPAQTEASGSVKNALRPQVMNDAAGIHPILPAER